MTDKKEKPRMEKGSISISASGVIEATLLLDLSKFSSGSMLMKLSDTDLKVMEDDNKTQVGSIGIAIGGTMYVNIKDGENTRTWRLDPLQIFDMVRQAEKEQYLK